MLDTPYLLKTHREKIKSLVKLARRNIQPPPPVGQMTNCFNQTLENLLDHRRSLQTQSPPVNSHILRQAHRFQHLRSKHSTVTNLHPFVQTLVKPKNLQARLSIRIISRLEPKPVDSHLGKEHLHESNQPPKGQAEIRNHPFHLLKFGQMSRVDGFVAENSVD